jgi:hypothetical protein
VLLIVVCYLALVSFIPQNLAMLITLVVAVLLLLGGVDVR